jgi:hypothetical protein
MSEFMRSIKEAEMAFMTDWGKIPESKCPAKFAQPIKAGKMTKDGMWYDMRTKSGRAAHNAWAGLNKWAEENWFGDQTTKPSGV